MLRSLCLIISLLLFSSTSSMASFFDDLMEKLPSSQQSQSLDNNTIVKGLKQALATGTERAVTEVAKPGGYFGNQLIKILLPDKLQKAANLLGTVGYQKEVDEFVLSMNRAAEKAAPTAAKYFGDSIREMSVEDAKGILNGGTTAATKFFEDKTRSKLFEAFKPTVNRTMDQVGTVQAYKKMVGSLDELPLASLTGSTSLDLSTYVTNKALDGLFTMVGEEEKKIRTNPAAQTTDLLRKVFGGK